jgi:hypothetical protein
VNQGKTPAPQELEDAVHAQFLPDRELHHRCASQVAVGRGLPLTLPFSTLPYLKLRRVSADISVAGTHVAVGATATIPLSGYIRDLAHRSHRYALAGAGSITRGLWLVT